MVNRGPELVSLWECLEVHQDHENLLYLTDNETTVQDINKWIGGGAKLSLSKTSDTDILKVEKKQLTDQSESVSRMSAQRRDGHQSRDETDERGTRKVLESVN